MTIQSCSPSELRFAQVPKRLSLRRGCNFRMLPRMDAAYSRDTIPSSKGRQPSCSQANSCSCPCVECQLRVYFCDNIRLFTIVKNWKEAGNSISQSSSSFRIISRCCKLYCIAPGRTRTSLPRSQLQGPAVLVAPRCPHIHAANSNRRTKS